MRIDFKISRFFQIRTISDLLIVENENEEYLSCMKDDNVRDKLSGFMNESLSLFQAAFYAKCHNLISDF